MRARRKLACASAVVFAMLAALALGCTGVAAAAPPTITIAEPETGSFTNDQSPSFAGATNDTLDPVVLDVYEGASTGGTLVASRTLLMPTETAPGEATWGLAPESPLAPGQYTAIARQTNTAAETGESAPVTFTIDTTPPAVSIDTLHSPTDDAEPTVAGTAGAEAGDEPHVFVEVHRGATAGGPLAATATVPVSGGAWADAVGHLADGTYTAQAFQHDKAGNTGESPTMTFTIDTTPPKVLVKTPGDGAILHVSRPELSGLAGQELGDHQRVKLSIYDHEAGSEKLAETDELNSAGAGWTTGSTGPILPDGIYTLVAEQSDEAGNVGSSSVTFTIDTSTPKPTLDASVFVHRASQLVTGPTPGFSGTGATEPEDSKFVLVNVYSGASTVGEPLRTMEAELTGSTWAASPLRALPDGTYTVQVEQTDTTPAGPGVSKPTTFTVDADPPQVTLSTPFNASSATGTSQTVTGSAGTAEGDLPTITVQLYAGSTAVGTPLQSIAVATSRGSWLATFGGLSAGTYTAQAEQSDDVGNIGVSAPTTFTLDAAPVYSPPAPQPPLASFRWVPATPHPGESVTLISTSTDASSPITSFAWALAGNGAFTGGEAAITTSFATAGSHTVTLSITDANGLSSTVAETIAVSAPAASLIVPFPIIRMAGSYNAVGAKIGLLTVQAPAGARVTVKCRGIGCPTRSETVVVASGARAKPGTVLITLHRFERPLHAGTVLVVEVTDGGEIGKYTRFVIHHGKLPSRQDLCLSPGTTAPIQCPS
jgi:large repetitive protein